MRCYQIGYQRGKHCKGGSHLNIDASWGGKGAKQAKSVGVPHKKVRTVLCPCKGQSRSVGGIVGYQDPSM